MSKNVIAGTCDRCKQLKPRRGAMIVEVDGTEKMLCGECADSFASFFNLTKAERAETYRWLVEGAA